MPWRGVWSLRERAAGVRREVLRRRQGGSPGEGAPERWGPAGSAGKAFTERGVGDKSERREALLTSAAHRTIAYRATAFILEVVTFFWEV